MSIARKVLFVLVAVGVLGAIAAFSILSKRAVKGQEVYLAQAERKDVVAAVTATGRIEPRTKINVQSPVIGEIVELPVKEGDAVRKGDLLVQVDRETYRSEVDRLRANLRMGRIAVEQQEVALESLRRTFRRNEALFLDSLVPLQVLEDAELEVRSAEINLKSLKEQISQSQASLTKAEDELRKTTIVSAIDGIVTQLNAEIGEMTLTGTMNNPGTVILVVSDMSEVLAEVDVDENRVVQVRPGQPARVVVDAIGESRPYRGTVTEIAGTALTRPGQQSLVFPVKILLEDPDLSLRPGMTAKARIEAQRADGAVTVPIAAVQMRPRREVERDLAARKKKEGAADAEPPPSGSASAADSGRGPGEPGAPEAEAAASEERTKGLEATDRQEIVFKVVDGKAVVVPVRTGISDESDAVVLEGIEEGDTVVQGPYRAVKRLKDGEAVRAAGEDGAAKGEDGDSGVKIEAD
mgnify:CR=1 FL=1